MPAIFKRSDDDLIQVLPSYSNSLLTEMKGKYVIDYPEFLEVNREMTQLDISLPIADIKANVKSIAEDKMRQAFPQFETFQFNYLEDSTEFSNIFSADSFPDPLSNAFLRAGYKQGDTPNSTCVLGRTPRKNTVEGSVLTVDSSSPSNRCLVTLEIDVASSTQDGLGRFDFKIYFKDCVRKYTKDSTSLAGTPADGYSLNKSGDVGYQTKVGKDNFLRVYISGDNGNSYSEIENLTTFSFGQRKDTVRLAFVNYSDWDINLLAYTLMY
jgi:hypothetical protein